MSEIHYRAIPVTLERAASDDGRRRLTGRLVPYNEVAHVRDQLPTGEWDLYEEGFRPGAFAPQVRGGPDLARRVELRHKHGGEGLGWLGTFQRLWDGPDGLYGEALVNRRFADDVDDLLAAGVHELSIEFRAGTAPADTEQVGGVRWRCRAHLHQVALEPKGAYSRAEVLSFRAEVDAQAAAEAAQQAEEAAKAARATDDAEQAAKAAEDALERRRRFEELVAEIDTHTARQAELVRTYGVTVPNGRFDR